MKSQLLAAVATAQMQQQENKSWPLNQTLSVLQSRRSNGKLIVGWQWPLTKNKNEKNDNDNNNDTKKKQWRVAQLLQFGNQQRHNNNNWKWPLTCSQNHTATMNTN